jgi:hypothetical protein
MNWKSSLAILVLALSFVGCDVEPVSIEVFPAVLMNPQIEPPNEWRPVKFDGSVRSPGGTYLVGPERLFSDWNITAFRPSPQPDGSFAINVRLNEFARRKMAAFSSDPGNLKKPVAIHVNGRWTDFAPILGAVGDRFTLFGLSESEVEGLQYQLDTR